jgi:type VI secretion system protein ImpK
VSGIYWGSAEVLVTAFRLGIDRDLPAPTELRERLAGALQQMVSKCKAFGVSDADIAEAHYALVAFIDERILKSNWPGRAEWMNNPLQLQIYREFRAGENFFARMGNLLQRAPTSAALEIYYLCLALGFEGAIGAQNARGYLEAYAARAQRPKAGAPLSPNAIPGDHYTLTRPRRPFALAVAIGCAVAVATGLGLLWWSLESTVASTAAEISSLARPHTNHG